MSRRRIEYVTGHLRFFANIEVDVLSTIGSPACSMEQIAVSGIYGIGAALPSQWFRWRRGVRKMQNDKLRHAADLGRQRASLCGRRDATRQPGQVEIRRETRYFHVVETVARRPYPGLVLKCRPIGVLEVAQSKKGKEERNDRIFAVPDRAPFDCARVASNQNDSANERRGVRPRFPRLRSCGISR